jgi:3-deoxy-7-phosphoheptulonate synthase/chorismate mutase
MHAQYPTSTRLAALRRDIEDVSLQLVDLLNRRARIALEICDEKRYLVAPFRDPVREQALLSKLVRRNMGPLGDDVVRALFRIIFDASVALMEARERGAAARSQGGRP